MDCTYVQSNDDRQQGAAHHTVTNQHIRALDLVRLHAGISMQMCALEYIKKALHDTHSITSALSADAVVIQPAGAPWQQRRRGGRAREGDNSEEMRGSPP